MAKDYSNSIPIPTTTTLIRKLNIDFPKEESLYLGQVALATLIWKTIGFEIQPLLTKSKKSELIKVFLKQAE